MPSWTEVLNELNECKRIDALDYVRRDYLKKLHHATGRNVIAYYSGWLQKPGRGGTEINDNDKNGFMAAIHGLDRSLGLDLILHTPGGDIAATESIVHYLRTMFGNNIRAVVPQISMSAGTMIACSCKSILMGKQSNLGPIDPQFGGIPAQGVLEEFHKALDSVKADPDSIPIWQVVVSKYHPTFLGECEHAIALSEGLVTDWLSTNMFSALTDTERSQKICNIMDVLNNHNYTKMHARHIHIDNAIDMGLVIEKLEHDPTLQDLFLTVHHAYMHTLSNSDCLKIIENHNGNAIIHNQTNN